jgi:hypothetical protein
MGAKQTPRRVLDRLRTSESEGSVVGLGSTSCAGMVTP